VRNESLVLQYRQLQRQEAAALAEQGRHLLTAPMQRLEDLVEEKTDRDLMQEIAKVIEPSLTAYLKHYTPFQEREARRRRLHQGLGISSPQALYTLPVATLDRYARKAVQKSGLFAGLTGSVGAVGGVAVAMLELPVLLRTATDTLETVSEAYGHDPHHYFEKLYLLMLVPFALTPDPEERQMVHDKMNLLENWLQQGDIPLGEREAYYPPQEAAAFCAERIARALVLNRLLQALPLAGALLGASMNFDFVHRLGRQGLLFYKLRYLKKRLGL